jgi:hypothetical protein
MPEMKREQFDCMPPEAKMDALFEAISELEPQVKAMNIKLDGLLRSPWRMAIPPISMKALGLFVIIMALIVKGDLASAIKLIGALLGVM